jgi:hypothetical protein
MIRSQEIQGINLELINKKFIESSKPIESTNQLESDNEYISSIHNTTFQKWYIPIVIKI